MRIRRLGAAIVVALGVFAAQVGLAGDAPATECVCRYSEQHPWSGPPQDDPLVDTCDVDDSLPLCARLWDVDQPLEWHSDAAACVHLIETEWRTCAWTTPHQDGEPGGFFDDTTPDNGDTQETGVCVEHSMIDDHQEPDWCINEYGDPTCGSDPAEHCNPEGGECWNDPGPGEECIPNTYDPIRCLVWVSGMPCVISPASDN